MRQLRCIPAGVLRHISAALAVLTFATAVAEARSTERESLLQRCWVEGIAKTGPDEARPIKNAKGANLPPPVRTLQSFTPIESARRGAIRRVELKPGSKKLIALTFDLCEQTGEIAGYDGTIIDYLRDRKIKATLFAGGKWMMTHPERTQQLIAHPLFEMANHGWTHRNTRLLDGPALQDEIVNPQKAYEEMRGRLAARQCVKGQEQTMSSIPRRMGLYRFPFGACNAASLDAAANAGLLAIQWDVSSGDPAPGQSASAIAAGVLRQVKPGSIVLFHANGRGAHTAEALPLLLPKLKAQGYEFVTVGELLAAGKPMITPTCYDSRPGDTDRYDRLLGGAAGRLVPSATESPRAPAASKR
jgi:peptidoglycan-N-acetylglucosamine deacetylase